MNETEFKKLIDHNGDHVNSINALKDETLPLILWGTGSLAASIKKLLDREKIHISCCWVDNRQEDVYSGIPVKSIEEIAETYHEVNVVIGHSHYELGAEIQQKYPFIRHCCCFTNVCYGIYKSLDYRFVMAHAADYINSMELLADELSVKCMLAWLNCKINDDIRYILSCMDEKAEYFDNPFFQITHDEAYVDIGAYTGDTIQKFLEAVLGQYNRIYAFEPDKEVFYQLQRYVEENRLTNISLFQCGCWKEESSLTFKSEDESSVIDHSGNTVIKVDSLDHMLEKETVTLIKINFLHGVKETLEGAGAILLRQQPDLIVTVGFHESALIEIPALLRRINSNYKIYLRYSAAMPARLILYATAKTGKGV